MVSRYSKFGVLDVSAWSKIFGNGEPEGPIFPGFPVAWR